MAVDVSDAGFPASTGRGLFCSRTHVEAELGGRKKIEEVKSLDAPKLEGAPSDKDAAVAGRGT